MELPASVTLPFEVYVNGIRQQPGVDFDQRGRALVFRRELAREGTLGFWRWFSLFAGVAGTYRKHDTIDIVYTYAGRRTVVSLTPSLRD